ncbi:MAG: bifunctional aspartate kinase/homoserine dehydrogenase I [bacterium]
MKILKFGGSSLSTPERVTNAIQLMIHSHRTKGHIAVVVSALGEVTDQLVEVSNAASKGQRRYYKLFEEIVSTHVEFTQSLKNQDQVLPILNERLDELKDLLHGVFLIQELSPRTLDFIMSFGELLSAFIICESLKENGLDAVFLDTRGLIITDETFGAARVNFEMSNRNIRRYFKSHTGLQVMTGFIASTENNETSTLGRGGSDYTAAIVAAALDAFEIEIWTDVDGVMTADPRNVPKAFSIESMSYEEAMEMSYFGAKVIHPPTMQPALDKNIPIRIRNSFNPDFKGTVISKHSAPTDYVIKGITSIPEISLLRLQGSGLVGVAGTAMRLFGALARKEINIILITQASSEHSICFAVDTRVVTKAKIAIEEEFSLEIQAHQIDSPIVEHGLSVIAVVGENMRQTPGISGRLFQALGMNGINVVTIAQGSSELNISVVIPQQDESKAVNVVHEAFFLSDTRSLNLFIVGTGLIGGTLLQQIQEHTRFLLEEKSLEINVVALANSRKVIFNALGLDLENWRSALEHAEDSMDISVFVEKMKSLNLPNSIFIDCTFSEKIVSRYAEILKANISIVTPNKKATSGKYALYRELKQAAARSGARFLHETNVGAGLPVIGTLYDLMNSGDNIIKIEAVLSGTLSYIFNSFTAEKTFSEVVREAMQKGFTEPDPRDDLTGMDVARKLLILARETGLAIELEDIHLENLVPEECQQAATVEEFFTKLSESDAEFEARRKTAEREGKVLRYIATLENAKAWIKLVSVDKQHTFYDLSGSDNVIAFTTDRYLDRPLVIKGPGAGADVTAAGVFADTIRISS